MYQVSKRLLDIVVSAVLLLVLAPVLAALAIWIRLASPGPILYRGRRVGRGGVPFDMLKFRSMVVNADKIGASSTADDDPRITRPGKVMRKFKLDELPQFINVLRGDMSLVGPRPQVQWCVDLYTPEERRILNVRPGITDWASMSYDEGEVLKGSTDPDGDYMRIIHPTKMRLGLYYVDHGSFLVDLKILLATALAIFLRLDPSWCVPSVFKEEVAQLRRARVVVEETPAAAD
jgi:lipopolysaccharide/colanic/teichoic acid biosynthesis glycosyltransferase